MFIIDKGRESWGVTTKGEGELERVGSMVPYPGDLKYTRRGGRDPGVRVLDLEGLPKEVGRELIHVDNK